MNNMDQVMCFEDQDGKFYLDHTGGWTGDRAEAVTVWEFQLPHVIKELWDFNNRVGGFKLEPR